VDTSAAGCNGCVDYFGYLGGHMTAIEVAKIAGVSVARVWQFCRQYKLNPQNISREDCNKLIARKHRKVKNG